MTRDEYDALILQKEEIKRKLDELSRSAGEIIKAMEIPNRGGFSLSVDGERATIQFRGPGCQSSCCGPSYEEKEVPATWVFGADWRSELQRQKEQAEKWLAEKEAQEADQERLDNERRDAEEFERLKAKYEGK
jgi:hypothetical protein